MATDQKKPFHEVLSIKLINLAVSRTGSLASLGAEMVTILDVLYQSKMPADAAHKIAENNAALPSLLAACGQQNLAEFAIEVFADLKGREDEKKKDEATTVSQ